MSKYLQESYDALLKENFEILEQNKKLLQRLEIAQKFIEKITLGRSTKVHPEEIWIEWENEANTVLDQLNE